MTSLQETACCAGDDIKQVGRGLRLDLGDRFRLTVVRILDEFLYTQRPSRLRRHTIPQTSRPAIDRLGMITRQRCQASDHPCRTSGQMAESVSLLLAISDLQFPKDAELDAAATETAGSDKKAAASHWVP